MESRQTLATQSILTTTEQTSHTLHCAETTLLGASPIGLVIVGVEGYTNMAFGQQEFSYWSQVGGLEWFIQAQGN